MRGDLLLEGVPAARVVDVAGVVPHPAPRTGGLAAGGRHHQGRVGGLPRAGPPVLVRLTPATLELIIISLYQCHHYVSVIILSVSSAVCHQCHLWDSL